MTGIDCDPKVFDSIVNFEYVIGNSTDPSLSLKIPNHDIIIDDGSHLLHDQIATFINFKDKFNYFYVIEDVNFQSHNGYKPYVTEALKECIYSLGFYGVSVYDSFAGLPHPCQSIVVHSKSF